MFACSFFEGVGHYAYPESACFMPSLWVVFVLWLPLPYLYRTFTVPLPEPYQAEKKRFWKRKGDFKFWNLSLPGIDKAYTYYIMTKMRFFHA
jgi:hypothetical protein